MQNFKIKYVASIALLMVCVGCKVSTKTQETSNTLGITSQIGVLINPLEKIDFSNALQTNYKEISIHDITTPQNLDNENTPDITGTHLDFNLDLNRLMAGQILYSNYFESEISDELKQILSKYDKDNLIAQTKVEEPKYSFSKTTYVIPNARTANFTPELLADAKYISTTTQGVTIEEPKAGGVRTHKSIPVFADAVIEAKTNITYSSDKTSGISVSVLVDTDENTKFMKSVLSISFYKDIPNNKGVLIATYNFAVMELSSFGYFKKIALKAAHATGQDTNSFKAETLYMLEQNMKWNW